MYAVQFFFGNPKSLKRCEVNFPDVIRAKSLVKKFPTHVFSHFPYITSLVGSVKSLAWNGDEKQNKKTEYMLKQLEYELSILSNFDVKRNGVVIHPGSFKDTEKGLLAVAKSINKINFTEGGMLLLENCAGEGTKLPKNFDEIRTILDNVDEKKKVNVGICVDTAHIWGVGDYDLSKVEGVKKMFSDFDKKIGMDKFILLHLNDSEVKMGAKKDRHARIGTGYIWGKSYDSLIYLLDTCKKYKIPCILETHPSDIVTISLMGSDKN